MTPQEMAASVAAIMTAFQTEPSSAVADRLVNTLPGLVAAPQRETILYSTIFAAELHRELCQHLFRDLADSFGRLERLDVATISALIRFIFEHLTQWHDRPLLRHCFGNSVSFLETLARIASVACFLHYV